jgi:hypothetical protein
VQGLCRRCLRVRRPGVGTGRTGVASPGWCCSVTTIAATGAAVLLQPWIMCGRCAPAVPVSTLPTWSPPASVATVGVAPGSRAGGDDPPSPRARGSWCPPTPRRILGADGSHPSALVGPGYPVAAPLGVRLPVTPGLPDCPDQPGPVGAGPGGKLPQRRHLHPCGPGGAPPLRQPCRLGRTSPGHRDPSRVSPLERRRPPPARAPAFERASPAMRSFLDSFKIRDASRRPGSLSRPGAIGHDVIVAGRD